MGKCSKCKKSYNGYPALSRADNHTQICPLCGETEAFAQFKGIVVKPDDLSKEEADIRAEVIKLHKHESRMKRLLEKELKNRQGAEK